MPMGFERLKEHTNKPQFLYYIEIYQSKNSVNVELSTSIKCDFLICLLFPTSRYNLLSLHACAKLRIPSRYIAHNLMYSNFSIAI